jgi:hypothetical protein
MPMADLRDEQWRNRLESLPTIQSLELKPSWNIDREHLTCFVCSRGDDERFDPPEWVVTLRAPGRVVTVGLHEECRARSKL